jgi:hypothetical protein
MVSPKIILRLVFAVIQYCAHQDPREALIVSLRREVNALQDENEHLRNALQLSASASEPSRSRKNSAGTGMKIFRPLSMPFLNNVEVWGGVRT